MPNNKTDRHRMARALADAQLMGDELAATRHNVSVRTLQRWRAKATTDAQLQRRVNVAADRIADGWREPLITFVTAALRRATELLEQETSIDIIARAVDRLANMEIVADALGFSSRSADGASGEDLEELEALEDENVDGEDGGECQSSVAGEETSE